MGTRYGFRDATTDPDQVRWCWHRQPDANVAIATGSPGPDVLDVDQYGEAGSGFAALNQLKRAGLVERYRAIVRTPNGGLHIYFTGSDQSCGRLRGHHPSQAGGRPYRVLKYRAETGGLDWRRAVDLLEPGRTQTLGRTDPAHRDAGRLAAWLATQGPESHNRNDGLFWAACRAAEASDESALAELAAVARSAGLGDREIRRTIESARQADQRKDTELVGYFAFGHPVLEAIVERVLSPSYRGVNGTRRVEAGDDLAPRAAGATATPQRPGAR